MRKSNAVFLLKSRSFENVENALLNKISNLLRVFAKTRREQRFHLGSNPYKCTEQNLGFNAWSQKTFMLEAIRSITD